MKFTPRDSRRLRLGLVVNPYAGVGGPAGRKGSDAAQTHADLDSGHLEYRVPARLAAFFGTFDNWDRIEWYVGSGPLGADWLVSNPMLHWSEVGVPVTPPTRAADTQAAVTALCAQEVDLLLFVGGDGTARDVYDVLPPGQAALGLPSGVKMHSSVFATSPRAAAKVVNALASGELVSLFEREVRDLDEGAYQSGLGVRSQRYGEMWVPEDLRYVQNVKQGGVEVEAWVQADMAAELRERLQESEHQEAVVIFGPGSTTQAIQVELGVPGTLLGVDVCRNVDELRLEKLDADDKSLVSILKDHVGPVILVVTAIGGQGYLIGRGNQQLSPKVLKRVEQGNLWPVMSKNKLKTLEGRPLLIDSNDGDLDLEWSGWIPVITGYRDMVFYQIAAG